MPIINNGASHFAAVTYTGNGSTQTISTANNNTTGVAFQPDFVWIKSRSAATNNKLTDSVRGATNALISNTTGAETTDTNGITAFTSTGFTLGSDSIYNTNGATYIAWCWKGGGTGVSNNSGTITSTVSANPTAGFSIVTYTGTGANATVGHGLGVAPSMIIAKDRSTSGEYWAVYTSSTGNGYNLYLNTTDAKDLSSTTWNNTSPTSSVFSIGTNTRVNASGRNYVAYCFAAVSGYSSMGSFVGNGSSDGPFIFTNFRPRWIMIKRTDTTSNWYIFDTSRDTYNVEKARLFPNLSDAESTNADFADYLSNGFKLRSSDTSWNASGGTYVWAAFCENPFKYSRAR